MKPILFDMETSDPDDALTLCMLASHPKVNLVGVTVTPGSTHQIGVVRAILAKLNLNIPVGSRDRVYPKQCVSEFHYKWLGQVAPAEADGDGHDVMATLLVKHPTLTILTGGPLSNLKFFLTFHMPILDEIVIQGGFAGDSVVAPEHRLAKFSGRETCPTFNLNGDIEAAKMLLRYGGIGKKYFVSKNVCHGVTYDRVMHERIKPLVSNIGTQTIVEAMEIYLKSHHDGKMLHDPLAAATAIDRNVCEFKEVEIYREKGEWGSRLKNGTNTFISVAVDKDKFEKVFIGN